VDITHIAHGDRPTGCATISVDPSGANQIVVASGANREVKAGQLAGAGLGEGDILLLQMEIDLEENWLAVKEAAAKGVRILLNNAPAAPLPVEILPDLSLLIVNEIEVMQAAAERGLEAGDPLSAARLLHESYGLGLIVTLGGDGSLAITADGSWQVPAPTVEVIDTVGAGDAFTGAFAAALESGRPLPDCLAFASAAGGLACRRHGAQASLALQEEIETLAAILLPRVTAI
jgi:ribokinase